MGEQETLWRVLASPLTGTESASPDGLDSKQHACSHFSES